MANTSKIKTRITLKHDTDANWNKAINFIPLKGEIIIYDNINKMKIGDGITKVNNLPFVTGYELDPNGGLKLTKNSSNIEEIGLNDSLTFILDGGTSTIGINTFEEAYDQSF